MGNTVSNFPVYYDADPDSKAKIHALSGYIDLASKQVGGSVVSASDETFGEAANLIASDDPSGNDGTRGIYEKDGWITKRHNDTEDWVILKLGCPGTIAGFYIDTRDMGAETACKVRIDGCLVPSEIGSPKKKKGELPFIWEPLLPLVEMKADRVHKLALWNETETVYNYIKVYIVPDGGISRLRVLGTVAPPLEVNKEIDLACVTNGAVVISATDETYGKKENLILPGYSKEEGTQGWITKRNRAAEKPSESAIIKLGDAGLLSHAVIETNNFIGNHPVEACIMACNSLSSNPESDPNCFWYQILSKKPLDPNTQNKFVLSLPKEPFSHVKLTIYPDGAVSRLRIFGHCVDPSSETSEDESTETATPNVEKPASTPSKPEPVVITPKRSGKKSAGSSHKRTTSSASNSAESPTRAKRGKNN